MVASIDKTASPTQGVGYFEKDGHCAKDDRAHREASAWAGKGAAALGLAGPADPKAFHRVLEGEVPGGHRLGRKEPDGNISHRPGRNDSCRTGFAPAGKWRLSTAHYCDGTSRHCDPTPEAAGPDEADARPDRPRCWNTRPVRRWRSTRATPAGPAMPAGIPTPGRAGPGTGSNARPAAMPIMRTRMQPATYRPWGQAPPRGEAAGLPGLQAAKTHGKRRRENPSTLCASPNGTAPIPGAGLAACAWRTGGALRSWIQLQRPGTSFGL